MIIEKPNSLFRVISTASNSYNIPVWAYVFYCLRVGDLSAVRREILSPVSMLPGADRDRMLVILDHLITVQSRKARVVAARNVLDAIDYFRQVCTHSLTHSLTHLLTRSLIFRSIIGLKLSVMAIRTGCWCCAYSLFVTLMRIFGSVIQWKITCGASCGILSICA